MAMILFHYYTPAKIELNCKKATTLKIVAFFVKIRI
ncbi:hypothetical protein B0I10_10342 [Flavobacterium lacus]|uniref:Uncharacterized protein n=1 Tax=Flavobacterium lacus TaxID=1353778 RepID=A0A328WTW5_9FLAO|nr:hypothetical protein B0I10_10342 [Flavobacterium lacus]